LPRELFDQGVKRYGFHGLSYKFIAGQLLRIAPDLACGRVVAAHLGSGASLCALEAGISRNTSMGFSTLDGIPMATRCGTLDPGVLIHLVKQRGLSIDQVEDMLYHRSGLLGMPGISADSRDLIASDAREAREALDLLALRIAAEIAALATTLGGLDGIVFTGGIGEHQPHIRGAVCRHLAWLGIAVDEAANSIVAAKETIAGGLRYRPVRRFARPGAGAHPRQPPCDGRTDRRRGSIPCQRSRRPADRLRHLRRSRLSHHCVSVKSWRKRNPQEILHFGARQAQNGSPISRDSRSMFRNP
jgi:Acetokinase family